MSKRSDSLFLTDETFWDDYWERAKLPAEIAKGRSLLADAITEVFDRTLPADAGLDALEIGGAPGQYLAYLHRRLGYRIHALDYSAEGCEKTRENFRLLGIAGEVHEGDMFDDALDLDPMDVVFSLGLIEHSVSLDALREVVRAHARFAKPGAILLLGCPNFRGIYRPILERGSAPLLRAHNLDVMDMRAWRSFEEDLGLEPVWTGYVGGFEPSVLGRHLAVGGVHRTIARGFRGLARVLNHPASRPLRRLNSPAWSAYAIGVYRTPAA